MSKFIKTALIAGMLGTLPMPAMAQYRDSRGPQAHGQQVRHPPQARHAPARPSYREVSISHGNRFRRGQRLNVNQRRYVVNDWSQRGLRSPPRGYRWVRENNNSGDYILIAAATGLIASILSQ